MTIAIIKNIKYYYKRGFLICSFSLISLIACTENPFSDPPEVGTSQIRGQVLLSHESDHSGVYVWIEQIGVSAYTNSEGDFLISLPPPASQGGGGGIDGDLIMYFYLANYKLDSARVSFLRGVPSIAKGDLNEEGNLVQIVVLSKLLNVQVSFFEKTISMSSSDSLTIQISLTSPESDPVASVMAKANTREYTPASPAFFIRKIDSDGEIFKMIEIGFHVELVNFISKGMSAIHVMKITFTAGELPTGTYEIIPYVTVRNVNPPIELLNSLGERVLEYHPDYLKLPFKIMKEKIILTE